MAASMEMQEEERDYLQKLPNEVLEEIFSYLDKDSVKNLRVVNKRCKKVVDSSKEILKKFDVKQANRLVIRYLHEKKFYEFRWCNYESKTARKIYITSEELKNDQIFYFAFKQMSFQRVMFKNLSNKSLSNEVLYFLCKHFSYCPKFEPTNLSFENVDFCVLSPTLLNRLLELCGQFLETFQINNAYGLNRNSINDSHIKQLNPLKIKRLTMQSMKFLSSIYHKKVLKITDESIKWLMGAGQFPTLVFEHCQITTPIMCRYIECWLKKAARDTVNTNIKSHSFMLKHCPSVSSEIFEKECIERKLSYSKSSPESSSTPEQTYTLFNENSSTEFAVSLC
uniref:F-box domain-containing protein n=1 Tax=Acrobeloides nanus TaxID=290746 RepID=A0A914C5W4_9BILA